jgi:hypothetical protein
MPLPKKLIRVAWMAIVLGVLMEVIVLLSGGARNALVRDTLSKVAWSSIVCFGVAVGASASSKLRSSRSALMGLAGLIAAPAAFATARAVHKAFTFSTGNAGGEALPVVLLLAVMKAAEYGAFGMLVGWLAGENFDRAWHYAVAGGLTGLYFGALIATVTVAGGVNGTPLLLNEVLFPIGCALVLFASRLLSAEQLPVSTG